MKQLLAVLVMTLALVCSGTAQDKYELGNVGTAADRPNEVIEFTNFVTADGKPGYIVKSVNFYNGKIYYKLVSKGGKPEFESNPDFVDSSLYDNDDLYYKTSHSVGKIPKYPDETYEFKVLESPDSNQKSAWCQRVFNKKTGETYCNQISFGGRSRIIFPVVQKPDLNNEIHESIGSRLSIPKYPAGDTLKFGFISDDNSNIKISLLSSEVYTEFKYQKYDVSEGYNLLNLDFKDVQGGNYLMKIDDANGNMFSTMIVVKK